MALSAMTAASFSSTRNEDQHAGVTASRLQFGKVPERVLPNGLVTRREPFEPEIDTEVANEKTDDTPESSLSKVVISSPVAFARKIERDQRNDDPQAAEQRTSDQRASVWSEARS